MAESAEEMTPLKKKMDHFGQFLSRVIFVICILIWAANIGHFSDPMHGGFFRGAVHYFKIAVALAVAAIPEGLPAVVTTCLALGTRKMARRNAIIRTLPSVEALGCVSTICSDKTGTLTTNQMSVSTICAISTNSNPPVDEFSVTGSTYAPEGSVYTSETERLEYPADNHGLLQLAACACLCNDAQLLYSSEQGSFQKIGESTEAALLVLGEKLGLPATSPPSPSRHSLSKHEHASYCRRHWESRLPKVREEG